MSKLVAAGKAAERSGGGVLSKALARGGDCVAFRRLYHEQSGDRGEDSEAFRSKTLAKRQAAWRSGDGVLSKAVAGGNIVTRSDDGVLSKAVTG